MDLQMQYILTHAVILTSVYLTMNYLKVQERVRKISGNRSDPEGSVTQTPVVTKTLTGRRKIYLFPLFYGEW